MKRNLFQLAWLACLLVAAILACQTLSGVGEDVRSAKGTAQAAVTQVQKVVTQAEGFATAIEESGALQTAEAFATEEGSQLAGTAKALATEAAERGLLQTAQAFATEQGSEFLATAEAAATAGFTYGEAPADIPVIEQENIVNFFGSEGLVSYNAALDYPTVLDFYKREMPANGWVPVAEGTVESENSAVLKYEKPDRSATVTLTVNPLDNHAVVLITILKK